MNIGQPFVGKNTGHTCLKMSQVDGRVYYYDFNDNAVRFCDEDTAEGMPVSIVSMEIE